MNFEMINMAFASLFGNKIRTMLSMLGIIIGVSTIIVVIGIGIGAKEAIEEQYKNLSVTSILVNPINNSASASKLSSDDAIFIREKSEYTENTTAISQGKLAVAFGKDSEQFTVLGVEKNFFDLSRLNLIEGRNFTDEEIKNRGQVVILGMASVDSLFEGNPKNAIGENISIARKKLEIVGISEESGSSIGPISFDDSVFVPLSTAEKNILGASGSIRLISLANDVGVIDLAMAEIANLLRENHRLRASDIDDFMLKDQGSKVSAAQESADTMSFLLIAVAAVVLIVSGIGIMNVMLVTVAERTEEIGIIKAIGGRQQDILLQFLAEAILLTLFAGILGIILGNLTIPLLNSLGEITAVPSLLGAVIAFLFSLSVGVFFGFYPAWKASKMDPVEALRSE